MYMPDSDENYPKAAQFIKDWYGQLGVKVQTKVLDSATLTDLVLPPEAGGSGNLAKYDIELWGWSRQPGSERPAPDLPLRRDRQHVRQQLLQPGLRQDVRPGVEAVG